MLSRRLQSKLEKHSKKLGINSEAAYQRIFQQLDNYPLEIACCLKHASRDAIEFPIGSLELCLSPKRTFHLITQVASNKGRIKVVNRIYWDIEVFTTITKVFAPSNSISRTFSRFHLLSLALFANSSEANSLSFFTKFTEHPLTEPLRIHAHYLLSLILRIAKKCRIIDWRLRWKLEFNFSKENTSDIEIASKHYNLADPFIFSDQLGRKFVFCEFWEKTSDKGKIAVATIDSNLCLQSFQLALDEPFHLSFPFIFEADSRIYMIPQIATNTELRVYESKNFPLDWSYSFSINLDYPLVDVICFYSSGYYWLIGSAPDPIRKQYKNVLMIFYSLTFGADSFWNQHVSNPVVWEDFGGRNGGFLLQDGLVFRVGQNLGADRYGHSFSLFQIKTLNPVAYSEEKVIDSTVIGSHHFSKSGEITVQDRSSTEYFSPIVLVLSNWFKTMLKTSNS